MEKPEVQTTDVEADLFHRPARLMRIASLTSILSWVILVVAIIFFGVQIFSLVRQLIPAAGQYGFMDVLPAFLSPFLVLLPGLFLAVVLQVLSEGVYVMMDIEENTRKS